MKLRVALYGRAMRSKAERRHYALILIRWSLKAFIGERRRTHGLDMSRNVMAHMAGTIFGKLAICAALDLITEAEQAHYEKRIERIEMARVIRRTKAKRGTADQRTARDGGSQPVDASISPVAVVPSLEVKTGQIPAAPVAVHLAAPS